MNFLSQDGSTVHVHRNHLIPYYPKESLLYPHLRCFMRFSDFTQFHLPEPIKNANSDSSPFNSDESASDDELLQKTYDTFKYIKVQLSNSFAKKQLTY